MQALALVAIVFLVTACRGDRTARTAEPKQERSCRVAADCAADEICRGPDGCEMASSCHKLAELTCGGPQTTMCGCDGATCQEVLTPRVYLPYRAIVWPDCVAWSGDPIATKQLLGTWTGGFPHPSVAAVRSKP